MKSKEEREIELFEEIKGLEERIEKLEGRMAGLRKLDEEPVQPAAHRNEN